MAVLDLTIKQYPIDSARLFITGHSYGGTSTASVIGRTNRFRAAAVIAPVIDPTSWALTADKPTKYPFYWFPGPPWVAPDNYWKRSALASIASVQTPALVIGGNNDSRVPISQSEMYFAALKLNGVDSAFIRILDESHEIDNRPSSLLLRVTPLLHWFARYGGPVFRE